MTNAIIPVQAHAAHLTDEQPVLTLRDFYDAERARLEKEYIVVSWVLGRREKGDDIMLTSPDLRYTDTTAPEAGYQLESLNFGSCPTYDFILEKEFNSVAMVMDHAECVLPKEDLPPADRVIYHGGGNFEVKSADNRRHARMHPNHSFHSTFRIAADDSRRELPEYAPKYPTVMHAATPTVKGIVLTEDRAFHCKEDRSTFTVPAGSFIFKDEDTGQTLWSGPQFTRLALRHKPPNGAPAATPLLPGQQ